jgi:hypothetical protein
MINIESILEYDNMDVVYPAQDIVPWRVLLARKVTTEHITIYSNNTKTWKLFDTFIIDGYKHGYHIFMATWNRPPFIGNVSKIDRLSHFWAR